MVNNKVSHKQRYLQANNNSAQFTQIYLFKLGDLCRAPTALEAQQLTRQGLR